MAGRGVLNVPRLAHAGISSIDILGVWIVTGTIVVINVDGSNRTCLATTRDRHQTRGTPALGAPISVRPNAYSSPLGTGTSRCIPRPSFRRGENRTARAHSKVAPCIKGTRAVAVVVRIEGSQRVRADTSSGMWIGPSATGFADIRGILEGCSEAFTCIVTGVAGVGVPTFTSIIDGIEMGVNGT